VRSAQDHASDSSRFGVLQHSGPRLSDGAKIEEKLESQLLNRKAAVEHVCLSGRAEVAGGRSEGPARRGNHLGPKCEELFWQRPIESSLNLRQQGGPGKTIADPAVGVWNRKGLRHEKCSICASDRCDSRRHCFGDTITSSSVARWLGSRSRRRTNCWRGDRWHSVQRVRLWPGLRLLWRARLLWRTRLRLLWRLCSRLP
jgi:hypothetical protein